MDPPFDAVGEHDPVLNVDLASIFHRQPYRLGDRLTAFGVNGLQEPLQGDIGVGLVAEDLTRPFGRPESPALDIEHLQELLDGFRFHYNRQRPHQGIGDAIPAERYGTQPLPTNMIRLPGIDEMTEPEYPPHSFLRKVGANGNIGFRGKLILVGTRYATAKVRVIEIESLVHIYHGDTVIRVLAINPDTYYQPKPRKEPPTQRRTVT